jgi:hypothetical protein
MNVRDITDSEVQELLAFLKRAYLDQSAAIAARYPDYQIRSRVDVDSEDYKAGQYYYSANFKIPFYENDVFESLLHKDNNGYLEINEFTKTMNIFCKTIFHRKMWNIVSPNSDKFLNFIYHEWTPYYNGLDVTAYTIFQNCDSLAEYYEQFVYNEEYKFVTLEDMRELFNALVESGIWLSMDGDLYQVYEDCEFDTKGIDTKTLYHSGRISKIDELHIRATVRKQMSVLRGLKTKLNFVPTNDPDNKYDGFWNSTKLNGKVWYIPLFLIFYADQNS